MVFLPGFIFVLTILVFQVIFQVLLRNGRIKDGYDVFWVLVCAAVAAGICSVALLYLIHG